MLTIHSFTCIQHACAAVNSGSRVGCFFFQWQKAWFHGGAVTEITPVNYTVMTADNIDWELSQCKLGNSDTRSNISPKRKAP